MIEKILRSVTTKFEHVVVAIEKSKDLATLMVDELMGSLQVHEQRKQRNTSSIVIEQVLESKLTLQEQISKCGNSGQCGSRGNAKHVKGHGRGSYHNPGHYQQRNANNYGDSRGRFIGAQSRPAHGCGNTRNVQRFNCHKFGHYASDCRTNKSLDYDA